MVKELFFKIILRVLGLEFSKKPSYNLILAITKNIH
jgi:hypothetical protein